ncbi:putative membrane protein [Saprospira grandis DSM 2844]|uniref:Protease PrsW n=1 Tax=Saprospira grandis DSM 2844 TaxID=694433 RepID=J0XVN3_9BACT|nr:PrsW family glutamic-type intramembrane protease [Saprospira grandis]EJF53086.1 putative membrane protein [Saprospira grandis DSM 2844]
MDYYLLALSVLPGLAICYYIWRRDKHEPEPKHLLFFCFLFGMLSTVPAVFLETMGQNMGIIADENFLKTFAFAVGVVGFSEEFCKFLFLRYYIYPKKEFDEPMDGIVYSVMVSMGFATLENVLYVAQGGYEVAFLRMFTAVPAHAAFAVIMGYFVGLGKFHLHKGKESLFLLKGLGLAALVHGLYDFFIFQVNFPSLQYLTFVVLFVAIFISFPMIKRLLHISPHKEEIH